jgi:LuxR family transcriptional regulator, maltose regulon positive regulatory protein
MQAATIPEKFCVPPLPAVYLPRPRLDRLWEQRCEKRLVLVTAGAGYGKSSFLAARAREEGSFLWYRLDEGDTHPAAFASHLLHLLACSSPLPDPDEAAGDPGLMRRILAAAIAALRARGRTILVLDDAHLLQAAADVLGLLADLIRCLPETSTLVLSAREPLGIGAIRALAEGRASTIDARDLEFRADEVAGSFALRFGLTPSARQCRSIVAATEGWAAGLEILFQALDSPSPAAVDAALERLLTAGSRWFDYFAEEVIGRLDQSTSDFLHRSSVLPRLDPDICDRVLGRQDSRQILEQLVRRNLFTLREGGAGGVYRYHLLFRSYLRTALSHELPAAAQRKLHRDAARALLRAGEVADALELFAQAGDPERALKLIERQGEGLLASGRYEAIEKALKIVPSARLRGNPQALFVQGRLLDYLGRWKDAESVYRRILKLQTSVARRVELYSILGQIASRRGEHSRALTLSRAGLKERGARSASTQGRLLMTLGISSCELGRLDEGAAYLDRARSFFARRGDAAGQAYVDYIAAANVHLPRGEFTLGMEAARRALATFRALGHPRRTCVCGAVLSWVTVLAGDVGAARDGAGEVRRLAETLGLRQQEALALYVLGYCSFLEGDLTGASEYLQESFRLGDLLGESDARILPRLLQAECLLASGNRPAARSLAEECLATARRMKDPLQQAQCRVVLGRAAVKEDADAARVHWRSAENTFRRLGTLFDLHRVLLLRLCAGEFDPREHRGLLANLTSGAARCGHDALFLVMEPDCAARVLPAALRDDTGHEYAAALLARLGERAVKEIQPLTQESDDEVRTRAVELLAQIGGPRARGVLAHLARGDATRASARLAQDELARAPVQPLRIEALGSFRVSIGDTPVADGCWRSARPRRLFQFLLLQRFRWVTRDQIIEALWPEADPDKARGNLWQSVYRLRHVLEPDLKDLRASRYVRSSEESYRIEPGDGHTCDFIEFEEAIRQGGRLAAARRGRAADPLFRRALELYKGEFLAESPYEEFAAPEREHLRDLFLQASTKLADMCASSRRWAECIPLAKNGLREDPYNEELCYHLIQAHVSLGHRHEAVETYREFEQRMMDELSLVPSARMQSLIEKIRGTPRARRS